VRLVSDGVHWIFEGFIRLAEHAFRLVLTIFHAVEVAFERLFAALAWQLEQAREDIWRTHQVLDRLLLGSCSHLAKLARDGRTGLVLYRVAGDAPKDAFAPHRHPGGEAYLVLKGVIADRYGRYEEGSFVWLPPGSQHTPWVEGDTLVLVLWPDGVDLSRT